jgi:hypothetical protein
MPLTPQFQQRPRVLETLDQDVFWLKQPKNTNLIASKVLEQLYGFK